MSDKPSFYFDVPDDTVEIRAKGDSHNPGMTKLIIFDQIEERRQYAILTVDELEAVGQGILNFVAAQRRYQEES